MYIELFSFLFIKNVLRVFDRIFDADDVGLKFKLELSLDSLLASRSLFLC